MIARDAVPPIEPSSAAFGDSRIDRARRLLLATRPAFLTASILPVLLGTAWGWRVAGALDVLSLVLALLATVAVHAGSNVLNDVGDEIVGADAGNDERIFPYTGGSRFIQNGVMSLPEMKAWGTTLLACAVIPGAALLWLHGPAILVFGATGIALGVLYSVPKVQLSAHGLGETAVAVAFGVLPVVGAAWLQSAVIDPGAVVLSIPVALWVAAILFVNEVPDIRADAAAGKNTLVVRIGVPATRRVCLAIQVTAVCAVLFSGTLGLIPWWMALPSLLLLPGVLPAASRICDVQQNRKQLTQAIEATLAQHTLGSLWLVVSVVVGMSLANRP